MAIRQDDTPVYRELSFSLAAGEIYRLNRTFEGLCFLDLSGSVEMSLNDSEFTAIRGGITYKMPAGKKITSVVFREASGSAGANVTIATADGDIEDNRASFAGNLAVVNAPSPNQSIEVDTLATDPGLVALAAAIIAAMREDTLLRAPITTLAGATYSRTSDTGGTPVEIISAATNANGVIIRLAVCKSEDGGAAWLTAGGNLICGNNLNDDILRSEIRNVFIPAGLAIVAEGDTSGEFTDVWYEVL
jgi:hypothetical protein